MKTLRIISALFLALVFNQAGSQDPTPSTMASFKDPLPANKFSFATAYHSFLNFGEESTNTHHSEFHFGYWFSPKDKIGLKLATWKMYAPMGMPMKVQLEFDERNNYPGRLRESGIGLTYQRMLWRGLFATLEVVPQIKTYLDLDEAVIGRGFKLYTTYHLGYHFPLFNNRMYIEPQIHCNYWPIDTDTPASFKAVEAGWNNYFLFEPNLYIGVKF